MLGASLTHRGDELLRRVDDVDAAAGQGRTAGIPLLYPWANRLAVPRYQAAGKRVVLDPESPLLHKDSQGLVIHGIPWPHLGWELLTQQEDRVVARLDWNRSEWLDVFPFRHRIEMAATLSPQALTIETTIVPDEPMPVSFGFHPYLGIAGLPRAQWRIELPAMHQLVLDERKIPTGAERVFEPFDGPLADLDLDAGFALAANGERFALSGNGRRIAVELVENYSFVQIFAPREKEFIGIEPMTASANALVSGSALRLLDAGSAFRAVFRIAVEDR
jgi:aldose 1-epimerase